MTSEDAELAAQRRAELITRIKDVEETLKDHLDFADVVFQLVKDLDDDGELEAFWYKIGLRRLGQSDDGDLPSDEFKRELLHTWSRESTRIRLECLKRTLTFEMKRQTDEIIQRWRDEG